MKLNFNDQVCAPSSGFNLQRRFDQLLVENSVQTAVAAERTSRMEKRKGCHLTPPSRPVRGPLQRPTSLGRTGVDNAGATIPEVNLQVESPDIFSKFSDNNHRHQVFRYFRNMFFRYPVSGITWNPGNAKST